MKPKKITLANLRKDKACEPMLAFVKPLIKAKADVAQELITAGHVDWFHWLILHGYDVDHCRRAWFTWDESGRITATAGNEGTATAGYQGTANAGACGTATAGHYGTATAGDKGTAAAGYEGTATAGYQGTATAGACGTATAGTRGTATAGEWGTISIFWFDGTRYRRKSGDVGDGSPESLARGELKPNVPYRIENGQFVEVTQ